MEPQTTSYSRKRPRDHDSCETPASKRPNQSLHVLSLPVDVLERILNFVQNGPQAHGGSLEGRARVSSFSQVSTRCYEIFSSMLRSLEPTLYHGKTHKYNSPFALASLVTTAGSHLKKLVIPSYPGDSIGTEYVLTRLIGSTNLKILEFRDAGTVDARAAKTILSIPLQRIKVLDPGAHLLEAPSFCYPSLRHLIFSGISSHQLIQLACFLQGHGSILRRLDIYLKCLSIEKEDSELAMTDPSLRAERHPWRGFFAALSLLLLEFTPQIERFRIMCLKQVINMNCQPTVLYEQIEQKRKENGFAGLAQLVEIALCPEALKHLPSLPLHATVHVLPVREHIVSESAGPSRKMVYKKCVLRKEMESEGVMRNVESITLSHVRTALSYADSGRLLQSIPIMKKLRAVHFRMHSSMPAVVSNLIDLLTNILRKAPHIHEVGLSFSLLIFHLQLPGPVSFSDLLRAMKNITKIKLGTEQLLLGRDKALQGRFLQILPIFLMETSLCCPKLKGLLCREGNIDTRTLIQPDQFLAQTGLHMRMLVRYSKRLLETHYAKIETTCLEAVIERFAEMTNTDESLYTIHQAISNSSTTLSNL